MTQPLGHGEYSKWCHIGLQFGVFQRKQQRDTYMDNAIELSDAESVMAIRAGEFQYDMSKARGYKDKHGLDPAKGKQADIQGMLYEMAFAKMIGHFFSPMSGAFKTGGDVSGVQVRGTRYNSGRLIWRMGDAVDEPFALIIGEQHKYRFGGWCWGKEIEQIGNYTCPDPSRPACWMVEQADLRDLESLKGVMGWA